MRIITNGCFDLFHAGHKALLDFCVGLNGNLLVAVNTDFSILRLKGDGRPVDPLFRRIHNIRTHVPSANVVPFDTEDDLIQLMRGFDTQLLVKGAEYGSKQITILKGMGVCYAPMLEGYSTTREIERRRGLHRRQ